jgi:hypothetical protein
MTLLDRLIHRAIHRVADSRKYDLTVGPESDPVYYRWHVIPKNRWFNVYLHHFVSDDDSRALHDHRMANVSVLLVGAYDEVLFNHRPTPGWALPFTHTRHRKNHSVVLRFPTTQHRIVMLRDPNGRVLDCWSLFVGFPHWRNWGFACTDDVGGYRWRPHEEYVKPGAYGEIGRGCGE